MDRFRPGNLPRELTFRTLVDSMSEGLLQVDHDDVICFANKRFCEMFGYSEEELLGKTAFKLIIPEKDHELIKEKNRLRTEGVSDKYQVLTKTKSGETLWVEIAGAPLKDRHGKVIGSIAILTDISSRKRALEDLRRSEERFRSYFELGLIGMAITSPAKGWIEVNDEVCRILGYERTELLQTNWADLTHPDDLAADVSNFDRVLAGDLDAYTMDKRFIRKDGQIIQATIAVRAMRHPDGKLNYVMTLLQDITERKRAEEAIRANREELQMLTEKLICTQETERRLIARELHDQVGQALTAVKIVLQGEAANGREALQLIETTHPTVALIDIAMPELNGLETARRIAKEFPTVRTIILSMHSSEEYVLQSLQAGAAGYLIKDSGPSELETAIRSVAKGETYLSPAVSKHVVADYVRRSTTEPIREHVLTSRQKEVLQLIAEGNSTKDIARKLNISVKTVETHRRQIMERLDIHDVAGLVRYAIRTGIIKS